MSIPMHGFDMMIHIRMTALQRSLSYLYATGKFPASASGGGLGTSFNALFDTPIVSVQNTKNNDVEVRLPISEASLMSAADSISNIDGAFTLTAPLQVSPLGLKRNIVLALPNPQTTESFVFDHGDKINPVLAEVIRTKSIDELEGYADALNALPSLTVQPAPYASPFAPSEVFLRVMRPADKANHAITLAMPTGDPSASTGNIAAIAAPDLKTGYDAGINIASDTLLRRVVCPALADAVGIPRDAFAAPCKLLTPTDVVLNDQPVRYEKLEAVVANGQFRIEGTLTAQGGQLPPGVTAEIQFRIWIRPYLENGVIKMEMTVEEPQVDTELAWWVILSVGVLAIVTGSLFGLFFGPVLSVITLVAVAIAPAIGQSLLESGIATAIDAGLEESGGSLANESIDTGAARGLVTLKELTLDANSLTLYGNLDAIADLPLASNSTVRLEPGQGCDLDTGRVYRASEIRTDREGVDLLWTPAYPNAALTPTDGAVLLRQNGVFNDVTVIEIEQSLVEPPVNSFGVPMALNAVPVSPTAVQGNGSIYHYQTGDNRYGKAIIWRQGDSLWIRHVTFQRELGPRVDLNPIYQRTTQGALVASGIEMVSSIECNVGFAFGDKVFAGGPVVSASPVPYARYASKKLVGYKATSKHLALPLVRKQWFLNGQMISGSGVKDLGAGKTVSYSIVGDEISLQNEFQQTVEGQLRVRITDARLLTMEKTISFYLAGTSKTGGSGPEAREGQVNPGAVNRYRADVDRCLKTVRIHERLLQPELAGLDGAVRPIPMPSGANGGLPGLTQPPLVVRFAEVKTGRLLSTSAMQGTHTVKTLLSPTRPEQHYHPR